MRLCRLSQPLVPFPARRGSSTSGIALVIVLGMLVLVTVLVVAFLSSASTELKSSKSAANESDARQLADSAVNIVISQIQDATTTPSLAWASQPGMIRTYDNTGAAKTAYKLYSSGQLRVPDGFNPVASLGTEVPGNWASTPSQYTDLNKPVTVGSGASALQHYPIVDPSAVATSQAPSSASLTGSTTPIEGCFINTPIPGAATSTNPIPLPVQWLYVLKNGNIVQISGANVVAAASKTNPVVGRIAFWTDDESCKVNVNTASEGTYWDRPWAESAGTSMSTYGYERMLANTMPVQNEFQRYPGHPAMTCLSPIFPPLAGETKVQYNERIYGIIPRVVGGGSTSGTVQVSSTTLPLVPDNQRLFASVDEFLFGLSIISGTRQTNLKDSAGPPADPFTQSDIEKTRFFLTVNSRAPEVNLFNKPRITLWPLQANTATISDPANALNRNAMDKLIAFCSTIGTGASALPYYFQRYNTYTSPIQSPIPSSQSPSMDWTLIPRNQALFTYLQSLIQTPIPGLGGTLASNSGGKYSTAVGDQILTEMMDFIRSEVNTFSTTGTPNYYYTPFDPAGFVTGQGQIVPLVITPPAASYATKGFGRFPTVIQVALVFYRKDKLTITPTTGSPKTLPDDSTWDGTTFYAMTLPMPGTTFAYSDFTPPINVGAVLILQPFHPTPGSPPWSPNLRFVVNGLDKFTAAGVNVGFPSGAVNQVSAIDSTTNQTSLNGLELFFQQPPRSPKTLGLTNPSNPDPQYYPFFGSFTLNSSNPTFSFNGGEITIDIYPGIGPQTPATKIQTISMNFPSATLPIPTYARAKFTNGPPVTVTTFMDFETDANFNHHATPATSNGSFTDYNKRLSRLSGATNYGRYGIAEDNAHEPLPLIVSDKAFNIFDNGDTVRSVEARYAGPALGDYRLFAGLTAVPDTYFEGHGMMDTPSDSKHYSDASMLVHSLRLDYPNPSDTSNSDGFYVGAGTPSSLRGKLLSTVTYPDPNFGDNSRNSKVPAVPFGLGMGSNKGAYMDSNQTIPGDWDTGPGSQVDGPFINKADEANSNTTQTSSLYYELGGYINGSGIVESGASFSPNRQIASAVAFGSLPSGIDPQTPANSVPWRTLLFCKNPAAGLNHPGFGTPLTGPPYTKPPDHAFLDLFTMPVVEPYAISDPFSSAGKVNMNYQIVPFTYLTRDTGVRAVLKSTNIMAVPTTSGPNYKLNYSTSPPPDFRYTINPDEISGTLAGFEQRWVAGDIFRSASEICDVYLVPKYLVNTATDAPGSPTYSTMEAWWRGTTNTSADGYKLTADNVRESPYGNIYPRLTTKSNTFTVHVIAQTLKKALPPGIAAGDARWTQWDETQDQVTSEFRGSFIVQRYLDPNSDTLVLADGKTPATELDPNAMVGPYKFRIISSKRFAP